MSAQLSVGREGSRSLYIGGRVSFGGVILLIFYILVANTSEQVKYYNYGQSKEYLRKAKRLCFGLYLDIGSGQTW